MPRGDSYQLQGQQGGIVLTGPAGTNTESFRAILAIDDVVLSWVDLLSNLDGITSLSGVTLPAGTCLFGNFDFIDVTSGTVVAYFRDT